MAKQTANRGVPVNDGTTRKGARKLDKARDAQRKAEGKVGKLRSRLESAETKLAKRAQRVSTLQARMQARQDKAQPAPSNKRLKKQAVEHDRLSAIGLAAPEDPAQVATLHAPQASQDGTSRETPGETAGVRVEADAHTGSRARKAAQSRANHAHDEGSEE